MPGTAAGDDLRPCLRWRWQRILA